MAMKYIVIRSGSLELMVTFPESLMHNHVLEAIRTTKEGLPMHWRRPHREAECLSAGFIFAGKCYGKSESIGIESRPALDSELFAMGGERFHG